MKWILLFSLLFCSGCKTVLVFSFYKDMALETSRDPWQTDSRAAIEYRVEKDSK